MRDVTSHLLRVFLAAGRRIAALHPAGVAVSQRPVVPDSSGGAGCVPPPVAHISSEFGAWTSTNNSPSLLQKSEETVDFSSAAGEKKYGESESKIRISKAGKERDR